MDDKTIRELLDALRGLLALHIAHHNHPQHAAARALLRRINGEGEG